MVILEGMDSSGKSNLARALSDNPIHPSGHPKNYAEALPYMDEQDKSIGTSDVYDRVTCISTMAYRLDLSLQSDLMHRALKLWRGGAVFIYCRPPTKLLLDQSGHTSSEYDTEYTINILKNHSPEIISRYDEIFKYIPHIDYDYTKGAFIV